MSKLITLYSKIINFGVTTTNDILEQKRILLLNELIVWVFLLQCSNYFILIAIGKYEDLLNVALSQIFIIIPLVLNYFNKIIIARWTTILSSSLFIGIMMISMGRAFRMDYAFLFMAILSVILFSKTLHRVILTLFIIIVYLSCEYYLFHNSPLVQNDSVEVGAATIFILMAIFNAILLGRFIKVSQQIDKKLDQLSVEIYEKNEMLMLDQFQIEQQNKSLERANKELETFAYVASHDLKSPLRNITSFLNLIQRKLKNYPDKNVYEYLNFATSSAKQMHFLIQDILEFSKLGNSNIEVNKIDLSDIINNVLSNINRSIKEKNAIIEISSLPAIVANETQMTLLFQNLIENGIKYNDSAIPKVEITYSDEKNEHLIAVKDNGIGIPQSDIDKVFEMFQRLKDKPDEQGSGIGLAICKKIIEQHNGKIHIESTPKVGTTFFIRLPKLEDK